MTASPFSHRPLLIGAIAVALLSQGGCAWTRAKLGMDAKYQESRYNQPLEVPPGLDLPSTAGAMTVPDVAASAAAPAPGEAVPAAGVASALTTSR